MAKRQYKKPEAQKFYDRLIGLGSPSALVHADIFGGVLSAFTQGYEGLQRHATFLRGSSLWIAYYAGKDARFNELNYLQNNDQN